MNDQKPAPVSWRARVIFAVLLVAVVAALWFGVIPVTT